MKTHGNEIVNLRTPVTSIKVYTVMRSRDNVVGIATRYGMDSPVVKSRWGGPRFSAPVQTGSEAHPGGTGTFLGVKWPGRSVDHPPISTVEVKERVQLYLYSPSGPSWPVLG